MQTSLDFERAFKRLVETTEGGYVNDPDDPGGETKYGISKRSYPHVDIRSLTLEGARAIYWTDFWLAGGMAALPPAVAGQVFDAAVNHGISTALRMMQRAAAVADDGHIGPVTRAALARMSQTDLIARFIAERLDFWRRLSGWKRYGAGWAGRAAHDLRFMAEDT